MFTVVVLDLLLQDLFKKFNWRFDVTWLISLQFTLKHLKPVDFIASVIVHTTNLNFLITLFFLVRAVCFRYFISKAVIYVKLAPVK